MSTNPHATPGRVHPERASRAACVQGARAMRVRAVCVFFFFQAEDGIRDVAVTGVQTCALPIYRERLITEVVQCPLKWAADRLAWKLRLTDAKRTELKITTIGAIDCSKDQRQARRRKAKAAREKSRRAANRVPTI